MAEYIERETVIKALKDNVTEMERHIYFGSNLGVPKDEIEDIVNEIPAADVVEVVRCKDCKRYRKHPNSSNGLCYAHTQPYDDEQMLRGLQAVRIIMKPDGFCSYGERKEVQE